VIGKEIEARILRLHHAEKWKIGTIAEQLGLHHDIVERVIDNDGHPRPAQLRPSILDPFLPFMRVTLETYPRLRASRLHAMCVERGYKGGESHFRHKVAELRPKPVAEAYLRLATLPAEQAQVDWAHFGKIQIGRATRVLMAFVMVLSYSRKVFLRFFLGQKLAHFLHGHVSAFAAFGGVPRCLLYDNLKSVVVERIGDAIRFHSTLLAFAGHYRFEPRPVAIARGNEKGRVERAIRYVRDSFFAARAYADLDDLNRQAEHWCAGSAADRLWVEDRTKSVGEVFEEERRLLLPLPENPFPTDECVQARVGKTPYVRFDLNDYSVPHDRTRRTLVVVASEETVRVIEGPEVLAIHARSFDKGKQVEDPAHIQALVERKRHARKERAVDRLSHAAPTTAKLIEELGRRGENLGSATGQLMRLLDAYGAERLERAAREALERGSPHPRSVRMVLERERIDEGRPPIIPVQLPDDPRVRAISVKPHSLESYDGLRGHDVAAQPADETKEVGHGSNE
jgi:transposase